IVVNQTPILNPIAGPNTVCPGQISNYSVTSNVVGNFTWTITSGTGNVSGYGPNNSNAAANFTGSGPWILQASQTMNGCTGSITINVSKVPPPPPITVTPSTTVCSGATITASVTGVVPPGGYVWSATPGAVLTGGQGTTSATFTVNSNATITITSCGGSTTINVTVSPATVVVTSVNGPCNATLTASPGGGTYAWFLNGNPYGSGNPITVNQNGTYVVQATYAGGCQATYTIVVNGITPVNANITAVGNLCNGGSVTLTAGIPANCPGAVFTWSNAFVGNPLVTNLPGNYFVTITCSNGCSAVSNTIPVSPCNGNGNGNGNCINDLVISPSNCNNPVTLTTNVPAGCATNTTTWYYGDGASNTSGIHLYNNIGTYTVLAIMTCGDGTVHCGTQNITVPMVDSFTNVITCGVNGWNVQLQDASLYLPTYSGYSILWSTTCGTLSATNIPNPVLTVPIGCNPTVTLTISKNGCTLTKSFTFSFPGTAFTINGPTTVCAGSSNSYSSSYTTGVISYNWTFGDLPPTTGVTNPISHVFTGTPNNPTISLQIKDQYGCIFNTSITVNVIVPRKLLISPSPIVKICPDCAPPLTLTTAPLAGWTGYQWYHNGSAIGGANGPTYQLCNFDASGNYWVTANDAQNNNCSVNSDTVMVVYLPKPIADIQGPTINCAGLLPGTISLYNSVTNPNYTYFWSATGPGTVTFTPDNLQSYANVSVNAYGAYQFILTVTDITTGCMAKDTFCAYLYQSPNLTVNAPAGPLCEGTAYTFTTSVLPPNPNYVYTWSNGMTGPTMTTSQAGTYFVTVTNPVSGCSDTKFAGIINQRPNVSLFPLGCDTLCDTVKLIPPLPLAPGQTYGTQYTIKWYVDGNLVYTGPFLNLAGLTLGAHQIYIVVTSNMTGCTSTSGIFYVYVKHCGNCDCKGSKWGDITVTQGNNPPVKLTCGKLLTLKCNLPYTFNASFTCIDTLCPGKTTYALYPPSGSPITGNMPLNYTFSAGTYILTIYGWCGGKKCDSCTIDIVVKCDCDCKESHWGPITVTPGDVGNPNGNVVIGNALTVSCGKTYNLNCNQPYTVNANYFCKDSACNGKVTYSLQPPTGSPITGTLALTFTPNINGTYILTLYGWCGNKICDSCVIKFKVTCKPCDCNGSHWGDIILNNGDNGGGHNGDPTKAVIGIPANPIALKCKSTYTINCNQPYTVNATYNCKDSACNGIVTYSLQPPTGSPITGNAPVTFTPTQTGTYTLTLYGWCGGKLCDSCVIMFKVQCEPCNCSGSHWGEITATDGIKTTNLSCGKTYDWKCKTPFTVNANFICAAPCTGTVSYQFTPAVGSPSTGSLPFTYTPMQTGNYTIVLYGMCGGKICDTCRITFHVDCPVDTNCCKHNITVQTGTINYQPGNISTIAQQTFTITGLTGVQLSEVRAEVLSYDISSNYNNECLGCKTLPFTWASVNSASNIGAIAPAITLYGGATTTTFNPTGAAVYQNPREVIWGGGNMFTINAPVNISFHLPPQPTIDCCELRGKICVKFTFRDENCNECEVIACFDFVLKKK
ncbi:MAG TPA: hypothetical protein VKH37_03465, partial [Ferruginibacter sp.]|nr:hypothetical protein [Ferruginibacter sp.]